MSGAGTLHTQVRSKLDLTVQMNLGRMTDLRPTTAKLLDENAGGNSTASGCSLGNSLSDMTSEAQTTKVKTDK